MPTGLFSEEFEKQSGEGKERNKYSNLKNMLTTPIHSSLPPSLSPLSGL